MNLDTYINSTMKNKKTDKKDVTVGDFRQAVEKQDKKNATIKNTKTSQVIYTTSSGQKVTTQDVGYSDDAKKVVEKVKVAISNPLSLINTKNALVLGSFDKAHKWGLSLDMTKQEANIGIGYGIRSFGEVKYDAKNTKISLGEVSGEFDVSKKEIKISDGNIKTGIKGENISLEKDSSKVQVGTETILQNGRVETKITKDETVGSYKFFDGDKLDYKVFYGKSSDGDGYSFGVDMDVDGEKAMYKNRQGVYVSKSEMKTLGVVGAGIVVGIGVMVITENPIAGYGAARAVMEGM